MKQIRLFSTTHDLFPKPEDNFNFKLCVRSNAASKQKSFKDCFTFSKLKKAGQKTNKALRFATKNICRFDSSQVIDGTEQFRVLRRRQVQPHLSIKGWVFHDKPKYEQKVRWAQQTIEDYTVQSQIAQIMIKAGSEKWKNDPYKIIQYKKKFLGKSLVNLKASLQKARQYISQVKNIYSKGIKIGNVYIHELRSEILSRNDHKITNNFIKQKGLFQINRYNKILNSIKKKGKKIKLKTLYNQQDKEIIIDKFLQKLQKMLITDNLKHFFCQLKQHFQKSKFNQILKLFKQKIIQNLQQDQ